MRIPLPFRLIAAAALGAAAVVLPATAASEGTSTIETEDPVHHWKPPAVTIEAGGAIVFKNPSATTPHGVHWVSTPATPSCEPSVPVGTGFEQSGTSWSGSCKFAAPGTYTFWCTVHGEAMKGTITVTAPGEKEAPKETTPTGTTTGTTPAPGTPAPGGSSTGAGAQAPGAAAASAAALSALRVSLPRHGATLHGALTVPAADAGGRLEVDLLAPRSALAAGSVRVGQLVRGSLAAGPLRFSVAPGARGLRALRRHGHLRLTMTVHLAPAAGAGSAISRRLTLRR